MNSHTSTWSAVRTALEWCAGAELLFAFTNKPEAEIQRLLAGSFEGESPKWIRPSPTNGEALCAQTLRPLLGPALRDRPAVVLLANIDRNELDFLFARANEARDQLRGHDGERTASDAVRAPYGRTPSHAAPVPRALEQNRNAMRKGTCVACSCPAHVVLLDHG